MSPRGAIHDFWNECYSSEHQKLVSAQEFKTQFCRVCKNSGCRNSGLGQTAWQHKVDTQVDILLENPRIADPNDPRYAELRQMQFDDALQEAMRLEISSQRGDWEPVTQGDALNLVGQMTGAQPSRFEEADSTEGAVSEPDEPEVLFEMGIPGKSGTYTVKLSKFEGNEMWTCSCPAFQFRTAAPEGCSHILQGKSQWPPVASEPQEPPGPPPVPPSAVVNAADRRDPDVAPPPPNSKWVSMQQAGALPKRRNTTFPNEGLMVDGSAAPTEAAPTAEDPWAIPPEKPATVPIHGKVVLGGKNKEK